MYVVAVTDVNGCRASDTLRVIVYEPPVLKANVPQTICAGEALRLNATVKGGKKPYAFSWEPAVGVDGANTLRPTVAPLVSTRYVLTLTDARGCVVKDSVTVIVQPPPVVDLGEDMEVCQGTPVTIGQPATGGNPPYTYRWEPRTGLSAANVAAPSLTAVRTRSYRVTVVDASGCSAMDEMKIIVRESPPMSMAERVNTCPGSPVQLGVDMKGGKPPFSYIWKPATALSATNIANPAASPLVTTTYSVTVTDVTGCRVEGSTTVEVLPPPVVNAGTDMLLCVGTASKLQAHVQGGRKPLSYSWSPPAGLSSTRILNPEINVRQSTIYTLSVMDATGCIVTDAVAVNVFPPPVAGAGPDAEICEDGNVRIGVPATGGTPPYRYNWSPVQGLDDPAKAAPIAAPVATTIYTVRVTDANGCVSPDETVVTVNRKPRIRLDKEFVICSGQGSRIRPKLSGGVPPYRYQWSPAQGLSSAGALDPVVNPDRNTVYTLTVTDSRGCSASATVHVVVNPCNKADAGEDVELCLGEKKTIGSSFTDGGNKPVYSWKPSKGLSSRRSTNPDASPDKQQTIFCPSPIRMDV